MSRIEKQIAIDAPAEQVWEVLADFGNVYKWAPAVTHSYSTSESNGGPNSSRHCDIRGFGSVDEDILEWAEGKSFRYSATPLGPIGESVSLWAVEPRGDGSTVILEFEYGTRFGLAGALLNALFMRRKLEKALAKGLDALKQYVEMGETVGSDTQLNGLAAVA